MSAIIYDFKKYAEAKESELLSSLSSVSFSSTGNGYRPEEDSYQMIQTLTEVIATCEYCARLKAARQ